MNLPGFEFAEPESIVKACQRLESQGEEAHVIAGGTDLLPLMKSRLKAPKVLVDLKGIPNLDQISYSDQDGLKVGALVSLRRLAADASVKEKYPVLEQATLSVGSPQLRAMGTLGGNLCLEHPFTVGLLEVMRCVQGGYSALADEGHAIAELVCLHHVVGG